MNKITKSIITILTAAMLLAGATACGKTAYDVAVKNGYQGTEKEWLATLQGTDGEDGEDLTAKDLYEEAVANGYQGTYLDFCKEIGFELRENNDVDTIARNMTSVVSIYAAFSKTVNVNNGGIGGILGGIIGGGSAQTSYYSSAGSGVIIDLDKEKGDALIVTNYHVIYDAECNIRTGISDAIYLYTYGAFNAFDPEKGDQKGNGIKATYVGGAMDYDIALLRVTGSEYLKSHIVSEAEFANSDDVCVGEKVFAIGNPDGAGIAVTEGIISVESEYITMSATDGSNVAVDYRVMRTDAAINSGNSGGALFNTDGELIGITNAKNASSTVDNMGYALPATPVKNLANNILRNADVYGDGSARVAKLGIMVEIKSSTAYYDAYGRLKIKEEFMVAEATAAPAKGKLQAGDTIKAMRIGNGEWTEFTRRYHLIDSLLNVSKGDVVELKVTDSHGNEKTVSITFDKDDYFAKHK